MIAPFLPARAYASPWWLPSGHAQTTYAAPAAPRPHAVYPRERWGTPDGDFIDLDWLAQDSGSGIQDSEKTPLLVLFHGLEGNSQSHYAVALMAALQKAGSR